MCVCVCACVLVAQLCLTLCDPMNCSWPDSPFYGIIQARILDRVLIPFSRGSAAAAAAAAKSLQSCPTLCNPTDSSSPGSPVPGILQARTLEWVAISFSNSWKWKVKVKSLYCVQLFETPWTTTRLLRPWDFPGKSTGVGCHCLLRQRIFPTQLSNRSLLQWQADSLPLCYLGRPIFLL